MGFALVLLGVSADAAPPPPIKPGPAAPGARLRPDVYQAPVPAATPLPPRIVPPLQIPTLKAISRPMRPAFANASFESTSVKGWTGQKGLPLGESARKRAESSIQPSQSLTIAGQKPARVGGDYWYVPVPAQRTAIGQIGNYWLEAQGTITSPELAIDPQERFVTFLYKQTSHPRLDVAIVGADGKDLLTKQLNLPGAGMQPAILDISSLPADKRKAVRVRLSLLAGDGVDEFLVWRDTPNAANLVGPTGSMVPAGLWGIVDLHTHLVNQMGFGGRMFAGAIHSSMDHTGLKQGTSPRTGRPWSESPSNMEDALKHCRDNHGNAPDGQGTLTIKPEGGHAQGGYPDFTGWPRYDTTIHQQAYVDWLKRAWAGGLRVAHVDVGNSQILADAYGAVMSAIGVGSNWNPTNDGWNGITQVQAIHDFASLPDVRDWAEVATTPQEARRIVGAGKLALVVGSEVDDVANITSALAGKPIEDQRRTIRMVLDSMVARGVRHVIPVHLAENGLGTPSVYNVLFDIENKLTTGHLFPLREGLPLGIRATVTPDVRQMNSWEAWFANRIDPGDFAALRASSNLSAHAHAQGLTRAGHIFVQEAMRRGMIVDIEHMSDLSSDDALKLAEKVHYPIVSSHTGPRELAFGSLMLQNGRWVANPNMPLTHSPIDGNLFGAQANALMASERDRSTGHLDRIRALGGMVGLGTGAASLPTTWPLGATTAPQNCDGSSTIFAQLLRYMGNKLGGHGVAIGTDINGLNGMANPRFGPYACYAGKEDPIRAAGMRIQTAMQQHPVKYNPSGGANPMGIRGYSSTRFFAPEGAYQDYTEQLAWMAIARFKAGAGNAAWGPAAPSFNGHDFGRDVTRLAYGFYLASTHATRGACPNCGFGDTHPDIDAAWDAFNGRTPASPYGAVKVIWDMWTKLETTATGAPLDKSVAGSADFDINVDGFAHYGLLPDYLQDVKNLGITSEELAPLFRGAEDYVEMWEKIEEQKAMAIAMPDVCVGAPNADCP